MEGVPTRPGSPGRCPDPSQTSRRVSRPILDLPKGVPTRSGPFGGSPGPSGGYPGPSRTSRRVTRGLGQVGTPFGTPSWTSWRVSRPVADLTEGVPRSGTGRDTLWDTVLDLPKAVSTSPEPRQGCPGPPGGCSDPSRVSRRVSRPVPDFPDGVLTRPRPPSGCPGPSVGFPDPSRTSRRVSRPVPDLHRVSRPVPDLP